MSRLVSKLTIRGMSSFSMSVTYDKRYDTLSKIEFDRPWISGNLRLRIERMFGMRRVKGAIIHQHGKQEKKLSAKRQGSSTRQGKSIVI